MKFPEGDGEDRFTVEKMHQKQLEKTGGRWKELGPLARNKQICNGFVEALCSFKDQPASLHIICLK